MKEDVMAKAIKSIIEASEKAGHPITEEAARRILHKTMKNYYEKLELAEPEE
jgi:hypothetical protein